MTTDYEKEYDNRARVPEHPEIFKRWDAEAEAHRAASPGATFGISYGPSKRQTTDLFPAQDASAPLALFIHGGWWRSLDPSMFSQMAKGPNARGVTVALAGYDLCPQVTITTIIEQMRAAVLHLWRSHKKRVMVYGHSAGGHLAACMAATDWKTLEPSAPSDLVPAAYAISGVFDLAPLTQVSQNADLRLTEKSAHDVSPLYWQVPPGRILDAVVGGIESSEFLRQSRIIVEAWRQGMAQTRYEEIADANHFTVLDPLTDPASAMTTRVVELARQVAGIAL
ncbi:MAG TPA: alpha/beta hydrolase [Pseudolabrys sp.]